MTPHLNLEKVTVTLDTTPILEELSIRVEEPGLVQVLGPNGAGKSTLLKTIVGIIYPQRGRVLVNGEDVTGDPGKAGRHVGYLPQDAPEAYSTLPLTAWEVVESEVLLRARRWPRLASGGSTAERVRELLNRVGLPPETWDRRFDKLSGGERQRVLLARALAHEPSVLLLDEPLAPIDPVGRGSMARLIAGLSRDRIVIVTSHDPGLLLDSTQAILLLNRRVYYYGSPGEVLQMPILRTVYGDAVEEVGGHLHIADPACRGEARP